MSIKAEALPDQSSEGQHRELLLANNMGKYLDFLALELHAVCGSAGKGNVLGFDHLKQTSRL
jgi:hypothetical protein